MSSRSAQRILGAVERLKAGDRSGAATLLFSELREGEATGERWKSVHMLAAQIGEIEIALEAARRYSRTEPLSLERLMFYWGELASYDRVDEAMAELGKVHASVREQPNVLHFLGTLEGQRGQFGKAEEYYRKALAKAPDLLQSWFALAMIKTFALGDADLAAMERLLPHLERAEPGLRARFLYGLAKAHHDCGEFDRAWQLYSEGAELRRREEQWNRPEAEALADALVRDFTAEAAKRLVPPVAYADRPALFVNGLPRSGTTLVEQILVSHSKVENGAEINLLRASLIPTGDRTLAGALAYQERHEGADPWGALASDYFHMLEMRFRTAGLVVDKTLSQSYFMGLLLHMLPGARVVWMRRNPEDVALSCFRNYFSSKLPWSWSLGDIAHYFNIEDRLFDHWVREFPDRILVVPYEEMVADSETWISRILSHAGLDEEPQVREFHKTARHVRTASVSQVRQPISTGRIGVSRAYRGQMAQFRDIYRG